MAGPGFARGGGANRPGDGAPTYTFAKYSQELHKIKRIWTLRGRPNVTVYAPVPTKSVFDFLQRPYRKSLHIDWSANRFS